ncbi:hypothetical protein AMS68_000886 [Peltaster fructicola]|uniref:RRM domain-containing protein n=1 Tax=Peltaster fructicola TaxID=286661 RepID=A0A6H0XL65_9PEZI|nr:hypothetical protein AMS68_000886 [Peltaster fructicola]
MADDKKAAVSFDDIIKAGRKKRENERLAQEIFGKRRSSTPGNASKKSNLGASLASRVGVTKRPASLSRAPSSQSRVPQADRDLTNRPHQKSAQGKAPRNDGPSEARNARNNGPSTAGGRNASHNNVGLSFKGAAGGPYIVMASNFAPGTTAADIESVMTSVGGEVTYCRLVASSPTVIAEMGFREKSGADTVIGTFNNKKADGRLLYVYMKDSGAPAGAPSVKQSAQAQPEPQQVEHEQYDGDEAMDIDENARSREAENKLREERRGGGREPRDGQDVFPSGPRNTRAFAQDDDYYYNNNRAPAPAQGGYQDGRYGFSGGGGGYGGRGRYYDDRRGYGGRGGQQWRN